MTAPALYDPASIVRDDRGEFWHDDLPFPDGAENVNEAVDISAAIDAQGYTWAYVEAPEDYPDACEDDAGYIAWIRQWQPKSPDGEGWLLACISDTENGPAAWFVRPKNSTAEVAKVVVV